MHKGVLSGPVNVFTEINLGYIFIPLVFMLNFHYSLVHCSSPVAPISAVSQLKSKLVFPLEFCFSVLAKYCVLEKKGLVSWQIMRCSLKQNQTFLRTTVHGEEALFM